MFLRRTLSSVLLLFFMLTASAQDMTVRTGCRRGTPRPEGLVMRRGAPDSQPKQVGGDFYHGERHQLVVLAAFSDCHFEGDESATLSLWNKIFNREGLDEEPFAGSVRDYFLDQSYGRFGPTFDLQYVQLKDPMAKYGSTRADDENSQFLVQDVVAALAERDIDWGLYDWNGDGYVNQLLIVYAGKGSSYGGFGGGYDAIWPHQWWLTDHRNPTTLEYCSAETVVSDGKNFLVDSYCAVQELTDKGTYGTFGTICHEYSHCFGFPDFYYGTTKSVGSWDLMDDGNKNSGGFCPPGYSAHERWHMGWLEPVELTAPTTVSTMPALGDEPQAYLIRNDGHHDEYYLVENRQQQGWDASLPGSGIVVFHVDFDERVWLTDYPNGTTKRYSIIPANNSLYYQEYTCKNWAYPYNGNDRLTNDSKPAATLLHANADGTLLMNKSLTNMSVSAGLASFDFMGGGASAITDITGSSSPDADVVYDLQGRRLSQRLNELPPGIYIVGGKKAIIN